MGEPLRSSVVLQVIDRTRVTKRIASAEVELYLIAKQKPDQAGIAY